jgi:PilZ domain
MEHRLGQRIPVDHIVRIETSHGEVSVARMVDISLSGAFLRTSLQIQPMMPVQVLLKTRAGRRRAASGQARLLEARVVRVDESGIGVEWFDFAPEAIFALVSSAHSPPASEQYANAGSRLNMALTNLSK